jgi:hypothetical protein
MVTWKEIAFKDDVASLSDQAAHAIGTEASAGVGTDASRHDHVHILGSGTVDGTSIELTLNKLNVVADGITAAKIADDAVGSEHIEALSANLDFAGQVAQDMVVHQATIGSPPAAVLGKWFQDSSSKKWYVCTDASA